MYYDALADIEGMLAWRAPLSAIESYLDACRELSDDEQAALWLLAWVRIERRHRSGALGLRRVSAMSAA